MPQPLPNWLPFRPKPCRHFNWTIKFFRIFWGLNASVACNESSEIVDFTWISWFGFFIFLLKYECTYRMTLTLFFVLYYLSVVHIFMPFIFYYALLSVYSTVPTSVRPSIHATTAIHSMRIKTTKNNGMKNNNNIKNKNVNNMIYKQSWAKV